MGFKCGIIGLPNVGKSTLFNAITQTISAEAANYPFCTIEPNEGRIAVPDCRLNVLKQIENSEKIVPTYLEVVDIAGLVRGAHKGEGLGNQFLGHIREVDALLHVLRCFDDDEITHCEGSVNPLRDKEILETELICADITIVERRLNTAKKSHDKDSKYKCEVYEKLYNCLNDMKSVKNLDLSNEEREIVNELNLLTMKPVAYICNVKDDDVKDGNKYSAEIEKIAKNEFTVGIIISASLEMEILSLDEMERSEMLSVMGISETGLEKVIRNGYNLLDCMTFLTAGPKEVRAWTVPKGARADEAAEKIHTDIQTGFICAEIISYDDYVVTNGRKEAKAQGKLRMEGRDYIMKEGDVALFRFNVSKGK